MALSFRGGVQPDKEKKTARRPIEKVQASGFVTIPLLQHLGEAAVPLVKVGDRVFKGQKIGQEKGDSSAPVHSSVSGTVVDISTLPTAMGETQAIVLENDFKETLCPTVRPFDTPIFQAKPEDLVEQIREKGIVDQGDDALPVWSKVSCARGKVTRLIINCVESEPYLTSTHRLLLEHGEEVIGGVKILLRAIGAQRAVFAMESGNEDAVEAIVKVVGGSDSFVIARLNGKYPQGEERHLIWSLMHREIPKGARAEDLGTAVFHAKTCWAIYQAFVTGMPMIHRLLTVSGECVKDPANLLVPLGTSLGDLFARCGGFSSKPDRIVVGGPMRGRAQKSLEIPVTKDTAGLIALQVENFAPSACIRCGRCLRVCPMHLMPLELRRLVLAGRVRDAQRLLGLDSCSECGCCSYVCPARIPLLQEIREGKIAWEKEKKEISAVSSDDSEKNEETKQQKRPEETLLSGAKTKD